MYGKLLPLLQPFSSLWGIGPKSEKALCNITSGTKLINLLFTLPREYVKYQKISLSELYANPSLQNHKVCVAATVSKHINLHYGNIPYKIQLLSSGYLLEVTYFRAQSKWLMQKYPINQEVTVCGKLTDYNGNLQLVHPDFVLSSKQELESEWLPIYPLSTGITQNQVRNCINQILELVPIIPEWLDKETLKAGSLDDNSYIPWHKALQCVHKPKLKDETLPSHISRFRLAYDEILTHILALNIIRKNRNNYLSWKTTLPKDEKSSMQRRLLKAFSYDLTECQNQAIKDISNDLASGKRMSRLIHGDVGSGKTIVGLYAVVTSAEAGYQSAFLAPTELLAKQHYQTAKQLLSEIMPVYLLTSSTKKKERNEILQSLKRDTPSLIIGTQSLLGVDITYVKLGLIIIDEQHRFGVKQRIALEKRGNNPHLLNLSATPIPRTMLIILYRDMEVSYLKHKLPGRKKTITKSFSFSRRDQVIQRLINAVKGGTKAYWVCPLVEEQQETVENQTNMVAVLDRYKEFKNLIEKEDTVFAIHGKMTSQEQSKIMEKYKAAKGAILVASTVIEVGVDIKDANIMIIENAERYGLAQLHQLRGRVGRSSDQAFCLLLYNDNIRNIANERIQALCDFDDGFKLAELDLNLRGSGELIGIKQSGFLSMTCFDTLHHRSLLESVPLEVEKYFNKDPTLSSERGVALKLLLQLQEKDLVLKQQESVSSLD